MTSKILFWKKQVEHICTTDKTSIQQQLSKKENAQLLPNGNSWAFVRYVLCFLSRETFTACSLYVFAFCAKIFLWCFHNGRRLSLWQQDFVLLQI